MTRSRSTVSSRAAVRFAVALWTSVLLMALAPVSPAQPVEDTLVVPSTQTAVTGDLMPGAEIVSGGRPLGIDEAVALSIQNNLDIEVERFGPMIAAADDEGAWGAYDPLLSADFTYDVAKAPNFSLLNQTASTRDRIQGGGIGIDQMIPAVGATVGLRYEGSSVSTRNTFARLSDQFRSSFFVSATVPLARGLVWNEEWTQVKTAHLDRSASREAFRTSLMDIVQGTMNGYWDLVAARDTVRVAQKSLETARALLDQTKTQYEVGVVSRVEVVEAEAGVADREFGVIQSANAYREAQDQLINQVLGRDLAAMTDLQFAPTDDPGAYAQRFVDVGAAVERAFDKRPELQQGQRDIEREEVSLKFAKNQRLPQFDAEARFGYVGISGEGVEGLTDFDGNPIPPLPNRPFDQSDDDFFTADGADNYSVTARFSIPIPNTTARKRVARTELQLRRAKSRLTRQRQIIILEVRSSARGLLASVQGIEAAERRRLAAEEQLRAERIRLEHGESTPFEVLQRESDLVEAESQKINALQTYRSAEIALERAQGTILDTHNIVLDEAAKPTQ